MKKLLGLLLLLCIGVLHAQAIVLEDFSNFSFVNNQHWYCPKNGLSYSWYSVEQIGLCTSSNKSWVSFRYTFGQPGKVCFSASTDGAKLHFFKDGDFVQSFIHAKKEIICISVSQGEHRFTWELVSEDTMSACSANIGKIFFIPDSSSSKLIIEQPKSQPALSPQQVSITYTDARTDTSFGNGDNVISNLESFEVQVRIDKDAKPLPDNVKPILPQDVFLIAQRKHATEPVFYFTFVVGNQFNEPQVKIKFDITSQQNMLHTGELSAPFKKRDMAKEYLEKEHPLQTKKFDYSSKKELDEFLAQFPDSSFSAVLFRFRLECCRTVRDRMIEANRNLTSQDDKEKNLLSAINEYHEFIEK